MNNGRNFWLARRPAAKARAVHTWWLQPANNAGLRVHRQTECDGYS